MAIGDLFKLTKLTIVGYADSARSSELGAPFEVQYNPETLSISYENAFQKPLAPGRTSGVGGWSYSQSKRLAVNLVLDGTNVGFMGVARLRDVATVAEQISNFLATCYQVQVTKQNREPSYLKLHWGKALGGLAVLGGMSEPAFSCRLASVDIRYTSFDRDGTPLRAELAAVFVEQMDRQNDPAQQQRSSADLTHSRVVVDGDTLPLLCQEIYGSPLLYLRVAQVNRLDDFRTMEPGQTLIFPPFDRTRKT